MSPIKSSFFRLATHCGTLAITLLTLFTVAAAVALASGPQVSGGAHGSLGREPSIAAGRIVRAVGTSAVSGQQVTIQVQLDSQGDEASLSFTLNFNPNVMAYVGAGAGNGAPAGSNLSLNTSEVAQGRLGVLLDATNTYGAGTRQVVLVTFASARNISSGTYPISFSSTPTLQSTSNLQGTLLQTSYETGLVAYGIGQVGRRVRAVNSTAAPGSNVVIPIQLDSFGDEASLSYTVNFDPTKLTFVSAAAGTQVPAGTVLNLNTSQVAQGRLGVLLDSTNTYAAGTRQILTINFTAASNQQASTVTPTTFGSTPALQSVANSRGDLLQPIFYEPGNVVISPTAAGVTVSGRVMNASGQAVRNATVIITDAAGNRKTAVTGSFGIYTFEDVEAGGSYVMGVSSKRYRFASRVVNITDSIAGVDFSAIE
jgi:hypothetical protein